MGIKVRTIDRMPPDLDKIVAALVSLSQRLIEEETKARKPRRWKKNKETK